MRNLLIALALFTAASADAATIRGRVVDSTGAALPGVTVESGSAAVTTDREGRYALEVAPGRHTVQYRLINFATVQRRIEVDSAVVADATLYVAASSNVVVTARQTFRNVADMNEPLNDLIGIADSSSTGVVTADQIARRPFQRAGEVMETVPGVVISQHSGEGKANQYYLRGFNLDHGTDIAVTVAGVPVNMPTHGHGQGYADVNFLIPELIGGVQYKKGPYFAEEGDFASAGAVNFNYLNLLDRPISTVQTGTYGFARVLHAQSSQIGRGYLLYAVEGMRNDGPWDRPDGYRRWNGVVRYTEGAQRGGWSVTGMGYDARWLSTDQIPARAVSSGLLSRYGLIDDTDGGNSYRYALSADWQRNSSTRLTQATAYALRYGLDLFSNFTYFLDDPENGDQFEQVDRRTVSGFRGSHRFLSNVRGFTTETVAGVQLRRDDIDQVGLFRTRERQRLSAVSDATLVETHAAIFAQTSVEWSPRVRTVSGLRVDQNGTTRLLSPKLALITRPWRGVEMYMNGGYGFHSNDARSDADRLVRTRGAEIGLRTSHVTLAAWGLDMASELIFVGDAGTTEATRPSRRTGVEIASYVPLSRHLTADAEIAWSRARFRDRDAAGDRIPGAVEGVVSAGVSATGFGRFSGDVRYRYFGPRPLIEDNSVRSSGSGLFNARLGYDLGSRIRVAVDVFNIFDATASDIDYFYESRLPGEPDAGVADVHTHPAERRSVRVSIALR
jgi:outer membrane cobalamin receptor